MCEGNRRTGGWSGLISEVHGCDKTVVDGECVDNFGVRKNIPLEDFDELVPGAPSIAALSRWVGCNKAVPKLATLRRFQNARSPVAISRLSTTYLNGHSSSYWRMCEFH